MKSLFKGFTEIPSYCHDQIRLSAAPLIEPHGRLQNCFEPEVTGRHDLFRVEILNTVNEFCSKLFLPVYAEHAPHDRRLAYGKHIILLSNHPGRFPRSEIVCQKIFDSALLTAFCKLRNRDPKDMHTGNLF